MFLNKGLGLVEVMITLAISSLLITVAIPQFSDMQQYVRADSQIRKLQQSLIYARNQAISYGSRVTLCPLIDNECHTDWADGFSIFIDRDASNQLGERDRLLFQSSPFDHRDTITYNRRAIRFQPEGLASGTNGTLRYCPGTKTSPYSRAVIINQSGRVRFSKKKKIECK